MSKKLEKLRQLVNKLTYRYGPQDVEIVRLQAELEALEAFESVHPTSRYPAAPHFDFRTRAKRLYSANANPASLSH